jgi:predicted transcriptional regulator
MNKMLQEIEKLAAIDDRLRAIQNERRIQLIVLGSAMRAARKEANIKASDMAARLRCSPPFLCNVERGRQPLPDHFIPKAMEILTP